MADTRVPETDTPTSDKRADKPLWAQTTFVLSVALVVVLVAAGFFLAFTRPSSPHTAAPRPQYDAPVAKGCGPAGDPNAPAPGAAPATTWHLIGHMAAPSSSAAGPADSSDGVPTCYAPGATGALFAAANFLAVTTSADLRAPAVKHLTAPGPGQDAAVAELTPCPPGQTSGCGQGPGPDSYGVQLAGFTFQSYGSGDAVIDLALTAQGGFAHLALHLTWTGQDWLIDLPVTGSPFGSIGGLPSCGQGCPVPAGYTAWKGA